MADAAAIAAANLEVDANLVTCGLEVGNARRFATINGIITINDFGTLFDANQTTDMMRIHNNTCGNTVARKLGIGHGNKLRALIHWVKDKQRRQLPVIAAEWTNDELLAALENVRNTAVLNKVKPMTIEVGEIDTGLKWFKWENKFMMKLDSIRSADGSQSCLYLARRPKPQGWDPLTDAADDKERLMYQVPLTGATFDLDNATAWAELKKVTIMTSAWTWIRAHEGKFRAAFLALITICEGTDHQNKRMTLANRVISLDKAKGGIYYISEYSMSFMDYSTELLEAYEVIRQYRNETASETMVTRLLEGMTANGGTVLEIAKNHVMDHLLGDYEATVTYMSNKVTSIFPPRASGSNTRSASQVQGEAKKKGLEHRRMNGKSVPFFNGVNVSNPEKNFSRGDMSTLGKEGRGYIFNRRRGDRRRPGRGYDSGRGGRSGRGDGRERHGGYGRGGRGYYNNNRQPYGDDNRNVRSARYDRRDSGYDDHYDDRRRDGYRSDSGGYRSDDSYYHAHDDRNVRQQQRRDRDDGNGVPDEHDSSTAATRYRGGRGGGGREPDNGNRGGQAGGGFGRGAYGRGGGRH